MGGGFHVVATIAELVDIYDTRWELGNAELRKIFGEQISTSTIAQMKRKVRAAQGDLPVMGTYAIRTDVAYKVWGLDIADLRKRAEYARKRAERKGML